MSLTSQSRSPAPHLPAPLTALIGRQREVEEACALLRRPDVRIVTLSGPGGAGKTRLSLEVGAALQGDFSNDVFFVPLAVVSDPAAVLPAIASAIGLREQGERPLRDELIDYIGDSPMLAILDNFEQVTASATDVSSLLSGSGALKVLVTSRSVLHVRGERELPVGPLPVPDPSRLPALDELAINPAVSLFLERAQATRPDLALTNENASAIAEICGRLDGLPLAIELAAARVKLLPPAAMLPRLANRLQLLTGGARDLPQRQQTLRNAIAWSVDLLLPDEVVLFRRLSVFAGGCTLETGQAVIGEEALAPFGVETGIDELALFDGVSALIDHSLIRQTEGADGEPRFVMLETIRDFATEALDAAGEGEALRRSHAAHFCQLAMASKDQIDGRQQMVWISRLTAEMENMRAALNWAAERGDAATSEGIAGSLPRYWEIKGQFTEGRALLARTLAIPGDANRGRANALLGAARLARKQGDFSQAIRFYEESLQIGREIDDPSVIASALNNLAVVAQDQGDYPQAETLLGESLALFQQRGEQSQIAATFNNLGLVARRSGDLTRATALYEQSLEIWRSLGEQLRIALVLNNLGVVAQDQGDFDRAVASYEEALAMYRERGDQSGMALCLNNLAEAVRDQGDPARAATLWHESLMLRAEQGDKAGIVESLAGLAGIATRAGLQDRAVRLYAASERMQREIGLSLPPRDRQAHEKAISGLRARMDAGSFSEAWEAGHRMTSDEAVADVTAGMEETAWGADRAATLEADKAAASAAGLTRRELEVLRLLVDGKSDKEIGDALFISHRTAMTHVQNVLSKLGVNSRTAAASHALRAGLI